MIDPTTRRQLQMSRQLSSGFLSIIIKIFINVFSLSLGPMISDQSRTDPTRHNFYFILNYISFFGSLSPSPSPLSLSLSLSQIPNPSLRPTITVTKFVLLPSSPPALPHSRRCTHHHGSSLAQTPLS